MSSSITLHHLEASRSIAALWLLEWLGAPYKLIQYPRHPETRLSVDAAFSQKGLASVHPLGRSPALTDLGDDGQEFAVLETPNILEHLLRHLSPEHTKKRLGFEFDERSKRAQDVKFWLAFSEGGLMLHTLPLFYANKGKALTEEGTSLQEQAIARGLKVDLEWVERSLRETKAKGGKGIIQTLDGGFGPADFGAIFPLEFLSTIADNRSEAWRQNTGLNISPAIKEWLNEVRKDSLYRQAVTKESGEVVDFNKGQTYIGKLMRLNR
ncbi:hypothetical protein IE81DRAFT_81244 [Ceraceosorus guamensis]|uniref:Uncharacterized protein n=1 Tax=Ceraceosorus guamensis TaxID=1522189 RepID=A0A316WBK5_9BASI|nr:hypothetical protein IE81DRAFT_81244 [Ceraceosorus guamensis]PWN46041.1 hypothetical protein IE81DRAFT_81244 [Ceraceosorus guamensis]